MSGKDHFEKEPFDPDVHEAFKRAVASRGSRPSIPNDAGIEAPEEIAERGRAMFRRALMQADADDLQEDLRQMLEALGMSAHARPYSPHRVFQEALNEMKRQLVAVPRSAASTVEPVAWQWRVRIGDGWSQWIDGKGEPGVYRLEYARAIDAGRVETRDLYAAPTTSPEPDYPAEQAAKAYKQIVASPEPDWKQDQAETSRISRNHRGSQSNTCQQWGNEPCVTPRCDCPNRLAVSGKDGSAAS